MACGEAGPTTAGDNGFGDNVAGFVDGIVENLLGGGRFNAAARLFTDFPASESEFVVPEFVDGGG